MTEGLERYLLTTEGSGRHTKPLTKAVGIERVNGRAKNFPGPWDTRIRGKGDWRSAKRRKLAMEEFEWRVGLAKENDIVMLRSKRADKIIHLRKIIVVPPGPVPGQASWIPGYEYANQRIQDFLDIFDKEFHGQFISWGICNCRLVRGSSSTWSQHSDWGDGCNAVDIRPNPFSKALGDKMYAFAKNIMATTNLLSQIFWWGQGAGGHFDHKHYSGAPYRSGRPSCA